MDKKQADEIIKLLKSIDSSVSSVETELSMIAFGLIIYFAMYVI